MYEGVESHLPDSEVVVLILGLLAVGPAVVVVAAGVARVNFGFLKG